MSVQAALDRYEQARDQHLDDLQELVRIPSVSFPGFPPAEVERSAEAVAALLRRRGLENVEVLRLGDAHPYVYGDWLHAAGKPTLLLYAHHDVQPPGREEVWKSAPFVPTLRDGRLFARGAADDKAGIVVHTASIAAWLEATGGLPLNVKVIVEGEEEIGSSHLEEFLRAYRDKLAAQVIVLTDATNWDTGVPALTTLLRGLVGFDIELRALERPLHSGMWGGPVPDPALGLARLLATLVDADGRLAVPGIDTGVRALSAADHAEFASLPTSVEEFRRQAGLLPGTQLLGSWQSPWEAIWRQPALTVNAIQASNRASAANIICDAAWARVTVRIVPDQDPDTVRRQMLAHLERHVPWGLELHVESEGGASWWCTDPQGPVFDKARRALAKGYGREPLFIGCGGTIPFAAPFTRALGDVPALLTGVEDPYTNAHAENESLHVGDFHKAVLSQIHLFEMLAVD
ncbi:MAG TPA: M20/M25/M40 family metallo-hydrolase [Candidatus Krumholzibacteria bacterium]|nr:M20/M25/M40 family metallo-hydrolase [Candidatus Krumholzibacteria bacterium]